MRGWILITLVALVVMVTADADVKRKKKKPQGCLLNGEIHGEGDIVYEDKSHCLRLRCIERTNKKGRTKYLLKAKPFKGCRCAVPCPKCSNNFDPVCGTNNKTYTNGCQLWGTLTPCGREGAELLHKGECGKCPTGCPDNVSPVCGTDGKTYDNECQLLKEGCETSSTIEVAHLVSCEDAPTEPGPGIKCEYNNKKYDLGESIQYLGRFCLQVSCQAPNGTHKPTVTFQDFQGSKSCDCANSTPITTSHEPPLEPLIFLKIEAPMKKKKKPIL